MVSMAYKISCKEANYIVDPRGKEHLSANREILAKKRFFDSPAQMSDIFDQCHGPGALQMLRNIHPSAREATRGSGTP